MAAPMVITPPPSVCGTLSPSDAASVDEARQTAEEPYGQADGRWVKLPEALFSSIMSVEPEINPFYEESKALSDAWLHK
jgi:hypothetical protein